MTTERDDPRTAATGGGIGQTEEVRPLNQPTTPARIAEAAPKDPTHPVVVERLTADMRSLAVNLDATDARSMAADEPWTAIQILTESLETLTAEVELHRPHVP